MEWLSNPCACGCTESAPRLFEAGDRNFATTSRRAWICRCPACDSLFPQVFPTEGTLGEAYLNYYTRPHRRGVLRSLLKAGIDSTRKRHLLRDTPRSARAVLDYGCGSGEYLRQLHRQGFSAALSGTDIQLPADAGSGPFEWLPLANYDATDRRYDWITLSHVIEHVSDPRAVLRRLKSVCGADGGLWLSTPNAQSFLIASFGEYARDVDFPRHRQVFSRSMLMRMLGEDGFMVQPGASPRVDVLMNFASCARNLLRSASLPWGRRLWVLTVAALRLISHLLKSARGRMADAPELVVVARPPQEAPAIVLKTVRRA